MPQAILLQDVEELGQRGTVVDVSKGYLRNFLIPRKLAQPATKGALVAAEARTRMVAKQAEDAVAKARQDAELLDRTVLTIEQQAGDDGRLFGSVTTQDIVDAIKDARGLSLDRRRVRLDDAIKNVGTYMVVVEVGDGVTATVKTMVVERT